MPGNAECRRNCDPRLGKYIGWLMGTRARAGSAWRRSQGERVWRVPARGPGTRDAGWLACRGCGAVRGKGGDSGKARRTQRQQSLQKAHWGGVWWVANRSWSAAACAVGRGPVQDEADGRRPGPQIYSAIHCTIVSPDGRGVEGGDRPGAAHSASFGKASGTRWTSDKKGGLLGDVEMNTKACGARWAGRVHMQRCGPGAASWTAWHGDRRACRPRPHPDAQRLPPDGATRCLPAPAVRPALLPADSSFPFPPERAVQLSASPQGRGTSPHARAGTD